MAAELGLYEQSHTSPPPFTMGNSRVVEGRAYLKECVAVIPTISSRYLSTSRTSSGSFPTTSHVPKASLRVQRSGQSGPPPSPAAGSTVHRPLTVPPAGGEPTGGRPHVTLSGWARPGPMVGGPVTLGLAPGRGPGCAMPGDISVLVVIFFLMGLWTVLSLTRHQGPVCLGRAYQGHIVPDNIAPRIIWVLKPLHPIRWQFKERLPATRVR